MSHPQLMYGDVHAAVKRPAYTLKLSPNAKVVGTISAESQAAAVGGSVGRALMDASIQKLQLGSSKLQILNSNPDQSPAVADGAAAELDWALGKLKVCEA